MARKYKPVELSLRTVPSELAEERARCPRLRQPQLRGHRPPRPPAGLPLREVPGPLLPPVRRAALRLTRAAGSLRTGSPAS